MNERVYLNRNIITTGKALLNRSIDNSIKENDQTSFKKLLKNEILSTECNVKFSKHSIERMNSRNIKLTDDDIKKIGSAVEKAKTKGVNDSLIILNNKAFIVSIKNNTIVTVMDQNNLKQNVITNIDGAVII